MTFINIAQLLTLAGPPQARRGTELRDLGLIRNAWLRIQDGRIHSYGRMADGFPNDLRIVDVGGHVILPGFVDCHTHLIEAGQIQGTFVDRCAAVEAISAADLNQRIETRLTAMARLGTTTVEIKSGYARTPEAIQKSMSAVPIREGVVLTEMSPLGLTGAPFYTLAANPRFVDALCDPEGLSPAALAQPLRALKARGLGIKLHVSVTGNSSGIPLALELSATSVEHLLFANPADVALLAPSPTIAVLLPAMPWYTRADHFAPGRALLDAGAAVALATDYNPGDSPCLSQQFVITLACREMGFTVEEAITAATHNAACAIGEQHRAGSLTVGHAADFQILSTNDYRDLASSMGTLPLEAVYRQGLPV